MYLQQMMSTMDEKLHNGLKVTTSRTMFHSIMSAISGSLIPNTKKFWMATWRKTPINGHPLAWCIQKKHVATLEEASEFEMECYMVVKVKSRHRSDSYVFLEYNFLQGCRCRHFTHASRSVQYRWVEWIPWTSLGFASHWWCHSMICTS